jgi:Mce-associated membrane protein
MPPSRRRPQAAQPPSRRPRVAGLRKPEAPSTPATASEADETPTQTIPAATLPTPVPSPVPRNNDGSTTTAAAGESLAARRARRAATKAAPVDDEPQEDEAEVADKTPADSGKGVPGWVGAIGSGARGMADSTKILVLAIAAVLLACAGAFFGLKWNQTVDNATTSNTAYVDTGTTAKVVSDVVNAMQRVLTYTYANPNQTAQDAQNLLTGSAQCQFNELYKMVRAEAPAQKITVTASIDTKNSGVEMIQGDQARLLLMVYQESTRGSNGQQATSEGVLEVGAIQQGDTWKVDNISTFGAGQNPANCK